MMLYLQMLFDKQNDILYHSAQLRGYGRPRARP